MKKKLRKLIDSSINSRKLRGEYKGLIAFVSDNKEKGDKEKREYLEKCKKKTSRTIKKQVMLKQLLVSAGLGKLSGLWIII